MQCKENEPAYIWSQEENIMSKVSTMKVMYLYKFDDMKICKNLSTLKQCRTRKKNILQKYYSKLQKSAPIKDELREIYTDYLRDMS